MSKKRKLQVGPKITAAQKLAQQAGAAVPQTTGKNIVTEDSFSNLVSRLGLQQPNGNLISNTYYELGPFISRNRLELEAMYRSSWLVGQVVDTVAEDMTKEGVEFFTEMEPDTIDKFNTSLLEFGIWHDLCNAIKWSRLYGGAIAVMLIDGADYSKPLDIERIKKDQFKGLVVLDRWMIQPSMGELITDICKDIGKPMYYDVLSGVSTFPEQKIHYTRVLRFDGIELPYYQKLFENYWGISVVERMFDRLVAFDSATEGAAQLIYRAYLRVLMIKGFREALATGGKTEQAVLKQFEYIRMLQSNEGITALDAEDKFETHNYAFSGLSDMLQQFAQQVSGAVRIPLVRLFGQSPSGFSTGDTDLQNYYDGISTEQNTGLRSQLNKLFAVMKKSMDGKPLPEDFIYKFKPLWQISESEKSNIAMTDINGIASAYGGGLINKATALREMRQQSHTTGRFTNIAAEDIDAAEKEEQAPEFDMFGNMSEEGTALPPESEEPEDENKSLGGENPDLMGEKGEEGSNAEEKTYRGTGDSKKKFRFKDSLKRLISKWFDKEEENVQYLISPSSEGGFDIVTSTGDFIDNFSSMRMAVRRLHSLYWKDSDFVESEHPRDEDGKFAKNNQSKKVSPTELTIEDLDDNAKKKYERITKLKKEFKNIWKENYAAVGNDDRAACLALIMKTGIRPGSDKDTHAKKKAYGATTLEGRHVIEEDGKVFLRYVGKKGVDLNIPIEDKELAVMLKERKKKAGENGRIFNTNHNKLLNYSHTLDGGVFKPKDFRTHVGTSKAIETIKRVEAPKDFKEYKKSVMLVAKEVSKKLGNTPTVALQAYIDPRVFSEWRGNING